MHVSGAATYYWDNSPGVAGFGSAVGTWSAPTDPGWRDGDRVRWSKGLEPDELEPLIATLPGEIVIHFRWASVGEVTPKLCHPFPITASATTRVTGHARAVLFHNGTWGDWRELLRRMPRGRVGGVLSDTRVAASLVVIKMLPCAA